MAKDKVSDWSSTPSNNTDVGGIDINEGCAPSGINNAIREVMAQIKDMQSGLDSDNFTVGGNLSVTGNATASGTLAVTGLTTATGGVAGDVFASNGTSKVLENGTDGTNATFTGDIFANNGTSKILENGTDGTNATFTGTSSKATNIVGGNNTTLLGSIPYQSNTDTTTLLSPNTTTTKRYLSQTGTGTNGAAPAWDIINQLTPATAQTASGTEVPFTSIPSWVNKITVMFTGLSLNSATTATKVPYIQLGTGSVTYTTSGYNSHIDIFNGTADNDSSLVSGIPLWTSKGVLAATENIVGAVIITRITSNTWTYMGNIGASNDNSGFVVGSVALGATLTALRFYVDGTITFDAGTVNIIYE